MGFGWDVDRSRSKCGCGAWWRPAPAEDDLDEVEYDIAVHRKYCYNLKSRLDWLVLGHSRWWVPQVAPGVAAQSRQAIFFDAGASMFNETLSWFLDAYKARGILFDHVYAWEKTPIDIVQYASLVPVSWAKKLNFYNIGVSTNPSDKIHNPVSLLFRLCAPRDYCVFKLDIDNPRMENMLVDQLTRELVRRQKTGGEPILDEFFWEHHVKGMMECHGWGECVSNETFVESYARFARLRELGVRAHSYI